MTQSEKIRDVLECIFKRRGKETTLTWLYSNAPKSFKEMLESRIAFEDDELPVLASNPRENNWVVITTKNTIWDKDGHLYRLQNSSILDVNIPFLNGSNFSKHPIIDAQQLSLKCKSVDESIIEIESGAPLVGVWNVLMHIALLNRKSGPD